jgi:hypothetical protein
MSRGKKLSKYFITYDPNSEINIVMPVSGWQFDLESYKKLIYMYNINKVPTITGVMDFVHRPDF